MDISIFQAIGPIMIGPSSSHTAGAARLARVAKNIVEKPFKHVKFSLHGSFAKTYKGHGTDKALVAGVLGIKEDDKRILNAFELAKEANITYEFDEIELKDVHENSLKMTFTLEDGEIEEITGASIGGGEIRIIDINGLKTNIDAQSNVLILKNKDKKGVLSWYSDVLSKNNINIANMVLNRVAKDDIAYCTIEVDEPITEEVLLEIKSNKENILSVRVVEAMGGN